MTRQEITEFYQEHHRRLYNISLRILRDSDEAAPVPVWTKIRQFLRPAPVIAFALATLAEITEEEEPLFTQLPEELSDRERGRILRNHYGRILAAAGQIK